MDLQRSIAFLGFVKRSQTLLLEDHGRSLTFTRRDERQQRMRRHLDDGRSHFLHNAVCLVLFSRLSARPKVLLSVFPGLRSLSACIKQLLIVGRVAVSQHGAILVLLYSNVGAYSFTSRANESKHQVALLPLHTHGLLCQHLRILSTLVRGLAEV